MARVAFMGGVGGAERGSEANRRRSCTISGPDPGRAGLIQDRRGRTGDGALPLPLAGEGRGDGRASTTPVGGAECWVSLIALISSPPEIRDRNGAAGTEPVPGTEGTEQGTASIAPNPLKS